MPSQRKTNPKKGKIPWSETPEGKEHAEFVERAKLGRPPVDESLCFVCQEDPPVLEAARGGEKFKLCEACALMVKAENESRNRVKRAIYQSDGLRAFEYTLGANLLPTRLTFAKLPTTN